MMTSSLYYEQHGSGRPVVCLHGFGASAYSWREIIPTLAVSHKVYALDLKGFGQSPKPRDGLYSVFDQSKLVLQFIADHDLTSVTLVGHSLGGGVALATAVELVQSKPETLASLMLFDAVAYRQSLPVFIRALRTPILGSLSQHLFSARLQVRSVLRQAYYRDDLIPEAAVQQYSAALRQPGGKYAVRETAAQIVPPGIDALTARYSSIRVPTLIVWGKHDEIVPLANGERLHAAIGGSVFVVVPDAGHVPHEEAPDAVRQAIRAFLREAA
jgi:pimeloyl-ACP methyl ester carboxylesterase